jgi:hypothetical protein
MLEFTWDFHLWSLYSGLPSLYSGLPSLYSGLPSLYSGLPSLYSGLPSLIVKQIILKAVCRGVKVVKMMY